MKFALTVSAGMQPVPQVFLQNQAPKLYLPAPAPSPLFQIISQPPGYT